MSGFQVPLSSSPPSTPDRSSKDGGRPFSFGASNPSTTPAGPPPSSAGSFTPAEPPPSSVFGSSQFGSQPLEQPFPSLRFSKENTEKSSNQPFGSSVLSQSAAPQARPLRAPHPSSLSNEYKAPSTEQKLGGFSADLYGNEDDEEQEEDIDDGQEGIDMEEDDYSDEQDQNEEGEDAYYEDDNMDDLQFNSSGPGRSSNGNHYSTSRQSDVLRLSREENHMDFRRSIEDSNQALPKDFMFGRIAKDIYTRMDTPAVEESDDLVLSTEQLVLKLYEEGIKATEDEDALRETLVIIPARLSKLWADYNITTSAHISEEYATAIGPGPKASSFAKANFLASLLLRLHHPGLVSSANSESLRSSLQRSSILLSLEGKIKQIPLLLLEWMDDYHDPYPSQLDVIQGHKPSPANHRLFWDTILNSLLRGRVVAVVNALKTAGWRHARHAIEDIRDNASQVGYTGMALTNINRVISDAVQVLQQCPAMRGDWNVKGSDWTLFRLRIEQALENLKRFAEGRNIGLDAGDAFSNSGSQSYTGTAKKAESQVPWHIYQNLVTMYNLILGDANAIVENAQDWCEATIGLVVWWNPGRDDQRLNISRSQIFEEETESDTYLQKLADSFYRATAESTEFQVNTLDPLEVGLASSFEGNVDAAIGFLRVWSGPVSSAVAEIAALGEWLPRVESQALITLDALDQDDMDLLGINSQSTQVEDIKDHTLIVYASALAERGKLESTPIFGHPKTVREGWEVAIEVLGRLDSISRSEQEVGRLLAGFPLESGATVNKLFRLLNDLDMTNLAGSIAEEYADSLGENSFKYGEALWYYALAHKSTKVKDVLDLLISFSLIHSVAYPPDGEMDNCLQRLISSPKSALTEMSKMDIEAAELLHKMLSGYATLRKFYDLRDAEVKLAQGEKSELGAHTWKSEAASALMAVITSSDDNIRGGLYDESSGAVVSVDFLLALLGEALVFVNQPQLSITTSQIDTLLRAIEDLQVVPSRVYAACNEFFQTVMASTPGLKGSSPMDLLKKTSSSMSGTSSYSMVGSSMFASQLQRSMGSSGVLVKANVKRGWDWRRGLTAGSTGEDILRIMRFGLAKDLAKVWILEADGQL